MMEYAISALEYGETPELASVCALRGEAVYEDPNHAGIPVEEAKIIATEISENGLSSDIIERKWTLLS